MRVAIVGSRNYPKLELVHDLVGELYKEFGDRLVIVSGGAIGVDTAAVWMARQLGLEVKEWLPLWAKHGRKAGHLRNLQIINDADRVAAFWDLESRGTGHSVSVSKRQGNLWKVFGPQGQEIPLEEV